MTALVPHPDRKAPPGPVLCCVMDGVGIGRGDASDAVFSARTPTLDWLATLPSATRLLAHGKAVGMPSDEDMGNSEVGHNVLGAGRVFDQGAKLVANAIADGSLFAGDAWRALTARVRDSGEPLHFIGLLSDGNVHSHIDHLLAMLDRAAREGVRTARVHALLDGRDVPPRSALTYTEQLEARLSKLSTGGRDYRVASGGGRMVTTMDRYEADWSIVERGWRTHVCGEARAFASLREAVDTLYVESGQGDQYLEPFVITEAGKAVGPIHDGASVIFFNFRGDRAVELTAAFEATEFSGFDRGPRPDVLYAGMMQYDGDLKLPSTFLVRPPAIDHTMGERLAAAGRRQLAVSETHKFGHVTYFWNGNRSGKFSDELETYVEVPSDLRPFEERPWMKAAEIVDAIQDTLAKQPHDFVRLNFANGDMVGHTGALNPTRVAVECVDLCVARLVELTRRLEGVLLVTADHGNADHMFDEVGGERLAKTSHSLNPVPLWIFDPRLAARGPALIAVKSAQLAHVSSTCLELMGFCVPDGWQPSLLA